MNLLVQDIMSVTDKVYNQATQQRLAIETTSFFHKEANLISAFYLFCCSEHLHRQQKRDMYTQYFE
jgi:hypothetical protein